MKTVPPTIADFAVMATSQLIFLNTFLILGAQGFIPRECAMNLPSTCRCRFPERPLVYCTGNLRGFPFLDYYSSEGPRVHTWDLSHNKIAEVPASPCKNCAGIKRLNLSHNKISAIHSYAFKRSGWRNDVEYLDLSYNLLNGQSLNGLSNLPSLKTLKLDNNKFTTIGLGDIPLLKQLSLLTLHGNALISCHIAGVPLKTIYLSFMANVHGIKIDSSEIENFVIVEANNLLNDVIDVKTDNFKYLALEDTRLDASDVVRSGLVKKVPKLKLLSLKGNRLSSDVTQKFDILINEVNGIEFLDLSHNQFTEITAGLFQNMGELKTLNFSSNNIGAVDWLFLESFPKLEVLDLRNNNINTSVGMRNIRVATKLRSLRLEGNPFHCSCTEMTEINNIAEKKLLDEPHLFEFGQVTHSVACTTPAEVAGLRIDLFFSQFCSK